MIPMTWDVTWPSISIHNLPTDEPGLPGKNPGLLLARLMAQSPPTNRRLGSRPDLLDMFTYAHHAQAGWET